MKKREMKKKRESQNHSRGGKDTAEEDNERVKRLSGKHDG